MFSFSELGIVGGIALLHWHEKFDAEETQEEGSQI